MRKKVAKILSVLVICCVFLDGCSGQEASDEDTKNSHQEVENILEEIEETQSDCATEIADGYVAVEQEEVTFPEGFIKLTKKEEAELQDIDGLTRAVERILYGIGVKSIENTVSGNFVDKSVGENTMIYVDAYVVADVNKNLLVHLQYSTVSTTEWKVFNVTDANTGNYYYELGKQGHDLYDYITGEIVSLVAEAENVEEVPHREGMYGVSDKDVFDIGSPSTFARNKVNNDVTGNWRVSTIVEDIQMVDYALSYYNKYFYNKDEIHAIVNFTYNTTTCIQYMSGKIYVTVYEYVDGEEHDANIMFTGAVLADYIVYPDNGDIEEI